MEKVFSDKTEEGIRLIWCSSILKKTAEGVRLLHEAPMRETGRLVFPCPHVHGRAVRLGICRVGNQRRKGRVPPERGNPPGQRLRRAPRHALRGADAVGAQAMPFASLKEARDDVLARPRRGIRSANT